MVGIRGGDNSKKGGEGGSMKCPAGVRSPHEVLCVVSLGSLVGSRCGVEEEKQGG